MESIEVATQNLEQMLRSEITENFKSSMDLVYLNAQNAEIPDAFICCVCLDLMFKPVVLGCGHACCFWCVHRSMNVFYESSCPLCRHPYIHLPSICQMLYLLILKMCPADFKRRAKQIFDEEKQLGYLSPHFGGKFPVKDFQKGYESVCRSKENKEQEGGKPIVIEKNKLLQANLDMTPSQVCINDLPCLACKQLVHRPVVLNCGHAYCEICVTSAVDGKVTCQVCVSVHPSPFGTLKVCLPLHKILEEMFPKVYGLHKHFVEGKQIHSQDTCTKRVGESISEFSYFSTTELPPHLSEINSEVHIGAGCDICGMTPIVGSRYQCKDCVEDDFDLCGECYDLLSKFPGRFNQRHSPDHGFRHIRTRTTARTVTRYSVRGMTDPLIMRTLLAHARSVADGGLNNENSNDPQLQPQPQPPPQQQQPRGFRPFNSLSPEEEFAANVFMTDGY